jgi:flagellum-specific peptidoglycan hydrolase FlgJ
MVTQELIQGAQAAQRKWRVWASVSLAQYGIESAWGTKEPKGSNNGFGIQALPGLPFVTAESFEYRHGVKVGVTERFAVFKSVADAFDKHGELIATGKKQNGELIYAAAMATTNAEDFVKALAPVYATAPDYATALLALMRADNLCQYDTLTDQTTPLPPPPKPPIIVGGSTGPTSLHPTFLQEFEDFIKHWL